MNALKICLITSQYGHSWSGLGTYVTNLINSLVEKGYDITVICPDVANEKTHQKVRLIDTMGMKFKPTLGNWFFVSYYFNKTLKGLLRKESFDIIHFADARDSFFCKIKDIPVIGTMHDYYFAEAPINPLSYKGYYTDWGRRWLFYNSTRVMEKRTLKRLSFVITNTDYVKESL
ncbi:MAG: glycosyltransferase family 4 protein, partial [Thermodesulfobacteriota bacterium]